MSPPLYFSVYFTYAVMFSTCYTQFTPISSCLVSALRVVLQFLVFLTISYWNEGKQSNLCFAAWNTSYGTGHWWYGSVCVEVFVLSMGVFLIIIQMAALPPTETTMWGTRSCWLTSWLSRSVSISCRGWSNFLWIGPNIKISYIQPG